VAIGQVGLADARHHYFGLPGHSGSLWGPYGVAIDRCGDVWVSNFNTPTTVEFARYQLSKSGRPPLGGPSSVKEQG
jgi:hypothetical protein